MLKGLILSTSIWKRVLILSERTLRISSSWLKRDSFIVLRVSECSKWKLSLGTGKIMRRKSVLGDLLIFVNSLK